DNVAVILLHRQARRSTTVTLNLSKWWGGPLVEQVGHQNTQGQEYQLDINGRITLALAPLEAKLLLKEPIRHFKSN
ncbi:MAG: hypothetical protein SCK28_15865, partial [Bacillota bacterium]|nr:hypothetical protein [Bacillota bacterium]